MADLDIIGAEVLTPEGLEIAPISVVDGVLSQQQAGCTVDLTGFRVLPGIIDVHGDGFERHLAPRRGAMKEMAAGLVATAAELASNGITTGVLAQFVSWEGGVRGEEFADQVFSAIRDTAPDLVTDVRAQLRLEIHLRDLYDDLPTRIANWGVEYVVFNDHLPHDRLAQGKQPPRMVGQALKAGRNPEVHFRMLMDMHAQKDELPCALDHLSKNLAAQNVRLGSHDDATAKKRHEWRARGAAIAEFPETVEAAEAAKAAGDLVVLGSPNVVRGSSHKGNASALDLITMGLCDALASDYHYPSPRRAALLLVRSGVLPFAEAWALVSSGPAKVLGLEDRGVIQAGKRADLTILDAESDRVAATMCGGRFSYISGDIADRLLATKN